jgi:hypothetical protein
MPILQVNFTLDVPVAEYRRMCDEVAQAIADVPGLIWKMWLLNEWEKEAGGIYLFRDKDALDNYVAGPIVAQIRSLPQLKNISMKRFDVMDEVTAVTRGPVTMLPAAA